MQLPVSECASGLDVAPPWVDALQTCLKEMIVKLNRFLDSEHDLQAAQVGINYEFVS